MPDVLRRVFPYVLLVLIVGAVAWAATFSEQSEAEFTFVNGTEIQSVDPHIVSGVPEARIIYALFEGLYNLHPETLQPIPGVAESYELSEDGKTYTFQIRPNARWSNQERITAEDFRWSWMRMLHPETAAKYAAQGYPIKNARKFNTNDLKPGDPVTVELDRPQPDQPFPQGTLTRATLVRREFYPPGATEPRPQDETPKADDLRVYRVRMRDGTEKRYIKGSPEEAKSVGALVCDSVLLDFAEVGVRVHGDGKDYLEVELTQPTDYFLKLTTFYTLFPVNRRCVENHGRPMWTKVENIVSNGAFLLQERLLRNRIRLVRNPHYWDVKNVALQTVDALAVESYQTGLNLYLTGEADWMYTVPAPIIPDLMKRDDFSPQPYLAVYFYRVNTKRKPFDDPRVRQALSKAIDRQAIIDSVTKANEEPSTYVVPFSIPGYYSQDRLKKTRKEVQAEFDPQEARRLLAEAGYPGGEGFPEFEILYNTSETHQEIARVIMNQWKKHLGIDTRLFNQEWASYLDRQDRLKYDVCRAGWVGDYVDPNTFLELWKTGDKNNLTGWSNKEYDELILQASKEKDSQKRWDLLHRAEAILVEEKPVIPLYLYTDKNIVGPWVQGWYRNALDLHPLKSISVDQEERKRLRRGQ